MQRIKKKNHHTLSQVIMLGIRHPRKKEGKKRKCLFNVRVVDVNYCIVKM